MSKTILESVSQIFRPQRPLWACEFTSKHVVVAGVDSSRKKIQGRAAAGVPAGTVTGSFAERNLADTAATLGYLQPLLSQAGFKGTEISVVIPDDATRIAFITAENLPSHEKERETFIRWKLKKSVPFDVESAQIAFQPLGPAGAKSVEVLVALSPRSVVEEYEDLFGQIDIHAGYVVPSTLAALNLFSPPPEDTVLVKMSPDCVTTTVYQNQKPRFYRRVGLMPLYDALYPTVMYYQDKLAGTMLGAVVVCGYEGDLRAEMAELQNTLGVPVRPLEPRNVDDIFKPALGALGMTWADSI